MGKRSKDKRDVYYRLAKERGLRARSAFKLLQIQQHFQLLSDTHTATIVDLCAAPGSWSEVCRALCPAATIIAVDLAPMNAMTGIHSVIGDITRPATLNAVQTLLSASGAKFADVVLCDGAPDVTNDHDVDEFVQHTLVMAALNTALCLLQPHHSTSTFVTKVFRGKRVHRVMAMCKRYFARVTMAKPRASRNSSMEAFIVCQSFTPPPHFAPSISQPITIADSDSDGDGDENSECDGDCEGVAFVSCGDSSALDLDSDQSYSLTLDLSRYEGDSDRSTGSGGAMRYRHLEPVATPINPPYQRAAALAKHAR